MDTYCTVQGNLVADPAARTISGGTTVVSFRVASSGRRFDRSASTFVDTEPMFMTVSCWRQLGSHVLSSLRKGDSVVVVGRLTYRSYDDRAGVRRSVHELEGIAVGPDLTRCPVVLRRAPRAFVVGEDAAGSEQSPTERSDGVEVDVDVEPGSQQQVAVA